MKQCLVVLSGGQDSTTCLYWALNKFQEVLTITFDYGQRHMVELDAAKKVAEIAGVPNEILPINTFEKLGGNSLTGKVDVESTNLKVASFYIVS